jgi:hypothetical protein
MVQCTVARPEHFRTMYQKVSYALLVLLSVSQRTLGATDTTVLAGAGDPMRVITLTAPDNSIVANFLSYGATLKNLWVKDKRGKFRDIVLGYDKARLYETDPLHPFFGGIVGRYANRIKNGRSELLWESKEQLTDLLFERYILNSYYEGCNGGRRL